MPDTCGSVRSVYGVAHRRRHGEFAEVMKKVRATFPGDERQCSKAGCQCMNAGELVINREYFEEHIVPRTSFILYITDSKGLFCGYALGHRKTHQIRGTATRFVYIDLLCSANRKGSALLAAAETFALDNGVRRIALRAATADLVPYYQKKGYTRSADQCVMRYVTRSASSALRELDVDAEFDDGQPNEGYWMSKCL